MSNSELEFVRWLTQRLRGRDRRIKLGVGDDMAVMRAGRGDVLMTADMLLDGVHFDTAVDALELIGRKAIACSLSDCAAMAVRPLCATISVAVPHGFSIKSAQRLVEGMLAIADRFACPIVGGDTTSWEHPLAIDVAMLAIPYPRIPPVWRSGARPGDVICVTGPLGGSLRGKHLTFTPRVHEARRLAAALRRELHAMMDLSDGLSLDLLRMCEASGVGAVVDVALLKEVVSADAIAAAGDDGKLPLLHALNDGEDFELLLTIGAAAARKYFGRPGDRTGQRPAPERRGRVNRITLWPVGTIVGAGYALRAVNGAIRRLRPHGYEHRLSQRNRRARIGVDPDDQR